MVKYPPHVIKVVKCLIFITSCEDHVIDLMLGALLQSVAGKFLGIVGQDPSDSKSHRLHVHIAWICSFI